MHYLSEEHIFLFLIQLFILLVLAKIMGGIFRQKGFPALAGEILVGILLGPTIFGRILPGLQSKIFPKEITQLNMLETVSWIGVLFLLLATGFEVSLKSAWKQGKAAFSIGVIGVFIPFIIGVACFWWLPRIYWGKAANGLTFTLFLSTTASISAIAVIARVLHDLEIIKSDLGLTTLSGFVVNDLLGWLVFAFVLGFVSQDHAKSTDILRTFFEIILFGIVCLTVGSSFVGFIKKKMESMNLPHPGAILSFIVIMALFCGFITQWIGVHAILGFFLAGVMAGNTSEISERTREIISQMVHSVFVPIFFASIGLKVDFIKSIDLLLALVFTAVAIGGKFIGAWTGAFYAKMSKEDCLSVGIAFIPGGAMEIVLGLLALEIELITETVFVAIVFAALLSSVAVGPILAWSLKRRKSISIGPYLNKNAILMDIHGKTKEEVIREICITAADCNKIADLQTVIDEVQKREEIMGTGLEKGLAIPHGRIKNIERPIIAYGRSVAGVNWDARDGLASYFIFLILSPVEDEGIQVQVLSAIAKFMIKQENQSKLMSAQDSEEVYKILCKGLTEGNTTYI